MSVVNADLKVMMNCRPKLSELPLKNFYRLVLQAQLEFTQEGHLRSAPYARFSSLPQKQLLTLNVNPPDSWLVESTKALYDLDNIKLDEVRNKFSIDNLFETVQKSLEFQVDGDVIAQFELEHLLLEGHCFDEVTGNPPRGLQFVLGTKSNPVMFDTIVMANLVRNGRNFSFFGLFWFIHSQGYFQLKANPGAYQLQLREGKSADIYDITK